MELFNLARRRYELGIVPKLRRVLRVVVIVARKPSARAFVAGVLLLFATANVAAQPRVFRAAAAKVDITPQDSKWLSGYQPRQSDGVLDNIYHRVVAMEAGDTQFYLVSSDLCLFSPTLYDSVTGELQKETGINPKHLLWSVTHTHAAPEVGPSDMYKALLGRSDHEWDRE